MQTGRLRKVSCPCNSVCSQWQVVRGKPNVRHNVDSAVGGLRIGSRADRSEAAVAGLVYRGLNKLHDLLDDESEV